MPTLRTRYEDPLSSLVDLLQPAERTTTWLTACDVEDCDGAPHPGMDFDHARPKQRAPEGEWFYWLIMAGRGWGKTKTGAEWLVRRAQEQPGQYGVIARTTKDIRETCIEGPSGILKALGWSRYAKGYNRSNYRIELPNGSEILSYSAEQPDMIRGPNFSGVWCDELAAWQYPEAWTEGLIPAIRTLLPWGHPRVCVTTTPKPVTLVRNLVSRTDGAVVITRGSTFENHRHLSEESLAEMRHVYEGTRLGRQELYGELLEDVEGALWTVDMIDAHRVAEPPQLMSVIVGVDPSGGDKEDNDHQGIVVAGRGIDGEYYVLADRTCKLSPDGWARQAIQAYHDFKADMIVAELNYGGAMVESTIKAVDRSVPVNGKWTGARGKRQRAEPVSALYEQGRVHHVGEFRLLERQMVEWVPESGKSPDRMDALVWAMQKLMVGSGGREWLESLANPQVAVDVEQPAWSPTSAFAPQAAPNQTRAALDMLRQMGGRR